MDLTKKPIYRNRALLDSVKWLACVNCGAMDGTIVPAHSNEEKGMGIKSPDSTVMALCFACHAGYDGGWKMDREDARAFAYKMNALTLRRFLEIGYVGVIK